jgi:hypothetical protein
MRVGILLGESDIFNDNNSYPDSSHCSEKNNYVGL